MRLVGISYSILISFQQDVILADKCYKIHGKKFLCYGFSFLSSTTLPTHDRKFFHIFILLMLIRERPCYIKCNEFATKTSECKSGAQIVPRREHMLCHQSPAVAGSQKGFSYFRFSLCFLSVCLVVHIKNMFCAWVASIRIANGRNINASKECQG